MGSGSSLLCRSLCSTNLGGLVALQLGVWSYVVWFVPSPCRIDCTPPLRGPRSALYELLLRHCHGALQTETSLISCSTYRFLLDNAL